MSLPLWAILLLCLVPSPRLITSGLPSIPNPNNKAAFNQILQANMETERDGKCLLTVDIAKQNITLLPLETFFNSLISSGFARAAQDRNSVRRLYILGALGDYPGRFSYSCAGTLRDKISPIFIWREISASFYK